MIDHRITAETGNMRRPHHNELPGVELERWIELDQKLDHVRRESVKAPHSASTEGGSNPSGGSQIHAAGNLEARITQRTGLTEQYLVSIGAKEGFAR
jgi:hypothetical protein